MLVFVGNFPEGLKRQVRRPFRHMQNEFGLTRDIILETMRRVARSMREFKSDFIDKYQVSVSNKLLSEFVSKVMEVHSAEVFSQALGQDVKKEASDKDPDLTFSEGKRPLEIKTTSTADTWTGGEFSKRPFDYLLISWGGEFDEFFVALAHLEKQDWQSRMESSFYGPAFTTKKLFDKKDKEIFLGRLEKTPRGAVKVVREKVV